MTYTQSQTVFNVLNERRFMRKLPARKRMKPLRSWHLRNKILHNETIPAYAQEGISRREEVVLKKFYAVNSICIGQMPRRHFSALSCGESFYDLLQFQVPVPFL
jgi:hypothetical protein